MHSVSYVACDAASALQKHPVLFGVWHAYKHCLLRVHEVFRRWWKALELEKLLGDDPASARGAGYPALVSLEVSVVAMVLAAQAHALPLRQARAAAEQRMRDHPHVRVHEEAVY